MDTSFWEDDDEDKVQIVYQDATQLPALQGPQEHRAKAGTRIVMREALVRTMVKTLLM